MPVFFCYQALKQKEFHSVTLRVNRLKISKTKYSEEKEWIFPSEE